MMTLDSITLFITLISLVNAAATDNPKPKPTPTITDLSCRSPGTIHFSISDRTITSVLVKCIQNGTNTNRAMAITDSNRTNVNVANCTINTPVKLAFFNNKHNMSYKSFMVNATSLVKEIIATCNGLNIMVTQSWKSPDVSNLVATKQTDLVLENALEMNVFGSDADAGPVSTVSLSGSYTLNINGPENLYILVESCDAASDSGFKYDLVHLYANRNPNADYGILNKFPSNIANSTAATMVGFRLLDSPVVYIRCVVDVCNLPDCPSLTTTTTTTMATTPTATKAPAPAATKASTPTATKVPAPAATKAPAPAVTKAPAPTATNAPTPTATKAPTPTATKAPTPTATKAPAPTATEAPTPTAAPAQPDHKAQRNSKGRRRRDVETTSRRATLSTSFRVESLAFSANGVNGGSVCDRRYVLVAGLLLVKNFLFFP